MTVSTRPIHRMGRMKRRHYLMCWRRRSSTGSTQALNLSTRRGNVMKIRENIWIKHLCAKASPSTAKGQAVARSPLTANLRNVPMFSTCVNVVSNCHHKCCYQQCCHCHHQWKEGGSLRVDENAPTQRWWGQTSCGGLSICSLVEFH